MLTVYALQNMNVIEMLKFGLKARVFKCQVRDASYFYCLIIFSFEFNKYRYINMK